MHRCSRVYVILGCLVLALLFPLIVLGGDIGVKNGDFEEPPYLGVVPDWVTVLGTAADQAVDPKDPTKQNHALHFTCSACANEFCQAVPITDAGWTSLEVSARVLQTGATEGKVEVVLTDDDTCDHSASPRQTVATVDSGFPANVWTLVTDTVTLDHPYGYIAVYLSGEDNFHYFDDISVSVGNPTAVKVSGLSGGAGAQRILPVGIGVLLAGLAWGWVRRRQS